MTIIGAGGAVGITTGLGGATGAGATGFKIDLIGVTGSDLKIGWEFVWTAGE